MRRLCDKALSVRNFTNKDKEWKGRCFSVADDKIEVRQEGLEARCYDLVYLFEDSGIVIGQNYKGDSFGCYLSTEDGRECGPYKFAPYLFEDLGKTYAVVRKHLDFFAPNSRRFAVGLNLLEVPSMKLVQKGKTWPQWVTVQSIHNGAVMVCKGKENYGVMPIDKFPSNYLIDRAVSIQRDEMKDNVYHALIPDGDEMVYSIVDLSGKLRRLLPESKKK